MTAHEGSRYLQVDSREVSVVLEIKSHRPLSNLELKRWLLPNHASLRCIRSIIYCNQFPYATLVAIHESLLQLSTCQDVAFIIFYLFLVVATKFSKHPCLFTLI